MSFFHMIHSITHRKSKLRDDRGSVVVEFAILAPVFLIFIVGIIDFGRLFWIKSTMQFAVEQTSRYAMVNPNATTAALETYASSEASTLSGITFTATTSTISGMNFRTIEATYVFSFLIPAIPIGDITLAAKSATPVNSS